METFGRAKETWLRTILPLPNGIPSHDTFSRVLAYLKPAEIQQGFLDWFAAIQSATKGELVALNGKTLRKSAAKAWGQAAVQMVSTWASENRLVLGQEKVDPDSNEITAVPATNAAGAGVRVRGASWTCRGAVAIGVSVQRVC